MRSPEKNREAQDKWRKANREKANAKARAWKAKNRQRHWDYCRNYHYKACYGITLEQFTEMFEAQDKKCAICRVELVIGGKKSNSAHFDHDHESSRNRGILCARCNQALGLLDDDPTKFEAAAAYLRRS